MAELMSPTSSGGHKGSSSSLSSKQTGWSIFNYAVDSVCTYSCNREVYTVDPRIGVIYRSLQSIMLVYVISSTLTSYSYLKLSSAEGIVTGWLETGSMHSGFIRSFLACVAVACGLHGDHTCPSCAPPTYA